MADILLSDKYKDFLKHEADAEALEGQTMAGKTTIGVFKFMLKVAKSSDKLHFIAAKTVGDCEKNIIQADLGIVDIFGDLVSYHGNGDKDNKIPHIKYSVRQNGQTVSKIIYVIGYDNKDKWQKALGSQFGCGFIDEINIANYDFVQESTMRCKYWMSTMNPDDPKLPVYSGYINRFRPLEKYKYDTPNEIRVLLTEPAHENWTYWFFTMDHNAGVSEERKKQVRESVPKGTKLYKNKILGIRGRSEGLVFSAFKRKQNVITEAQARQYKFLRYTTGVDTAYSKKSEDTIAFIFQGLTTCGKLIVLEEKVYNNKDFEGNELAPSDVVDKLVTFLDYCKDKWDFGKSVYVDNADQATIMELNKRKKAKGLIYDFNNSDKRMKVIDRIQLANGWLKDLNYLIVDTCENHIDELEMYQWQADKDEPEDSNDHTINAQQYGAMILRALVGIENQPKQNYTALKAGFGL